MVVALYDLADVFEVAVVGETAGVAHGADAGQADGDDAGVGADEVGGELELEAEGAGVAGAQGEGLVHGHFIVDVEGVLVVGAPEAVRIEEVDDKSIGAYVGGVCVVVGDDFSVAEVAGGGGEVDESDDAYVAAGGYGVEAGDDPGDATGGGVLDEATDLSDVGG